LTLQQVVNALTLGGSYALLAIGLTLTWGVLKILNVAHIQFIAWGGLLAVWLSDWSENAILGVVGATVVTGLAGAGFDRFPFAPVRRLGGGHYGAIVVGLGLVAIFEQIAVRITKGRLYPFPRHLVPTSSVEVFGASIPTAKLIIAVCALLAVVVLGFVLHRTRLGREIRAVASDRDAAEASGVNSERIFVIAQGTAAALAGLAGALAAVSTLSALADRGIALFLKGFAASVIGGVGSVAGAAIGGLLLGFIDVSAIVYGGGDFRDGFAFLAIIVMLIVAPDGVAGVIDKLRKRSRRRRAVSADAGTGLATAEEPPLVDGLGPKQSVGDRVPVVEGRP
jgi:branched-chain amino acid transport system permease protein